MENSTEVPQKKLEAELPYDPAIPLLGIYPDKTVIQKHTYTPVFTAALCPLTDEQIIFDLLSLFLGHCFLKYNV